MFGKHFACHLGDKDKVASPGQDFPDSVCVRAGRGGIIN